MPIAAWQFDCLVGTPITEPVHGGHEHLWMGTGRCRLCSCPAYNPMIGGTQCINRNAEGGTCNHRYEEHN
jgi:hypothetical protein